MEKPKISIIVPCYNQAQYLDECLQSVIDQTYQDWECIIVNDGSPDNTEEIAKKWIEKDSRFIYLYKENGGLSSARNEGLDKASGIWIQFLDCDDKIEKTKFKKSLNFENESNIIITTFGMFTESSISRPFCDLSKYEINFDSIISSWDIDYNIPIHCILLKKSLIGDTRFKTDFKAKEDWIFWLEIFEKSEVKPTYINEELAFYRMNPNGLSKDFKMISNINFDANQFVFNTFDAHAKKLLFIRLNKLNKSLYQSNATQKKYINQLQNTKILKYYLKLKGIFK